MICIEDGILRARLDGEMAGTELAEVNQHLASCADCGARFEKLSAERDRTADLMSALCPTGDVTTINPAVVYAQFRGQVGTADEPEVSWISRLFASRWRPAWGLAAGAVVVAILFGVNPVRTWAQRILAMLRVEKIAVVSIDPTTLMTGRESSRRSARAHVPGSIRQRPNSQHDGC